MKFEVSKYTTAQLETIAQLAAEEAKVRKVEEAYQASVASLTADDRNAIEYIAQGKKRARGVLAKEALALRAAPETMTLTARDGQVIHLAKIAHIYHGKECGVILSNGTVARISPQRHYRYHGGMEAAEGEWVQVTAAGAVKAIRVAELNGLCPVPDALVQRLAAWPFALDSAVLRLVLANGAANDMPQEVLLNWVSDVTAAGVYQKVGKNAHLYLFGAPPEWTIKEFVTEGLIAARNDQPYGALKRIGHSNGRGNAFNENWHHRLQDALDLWLTTQNLLAPDLVADDTLDIPIADTIAYYARHRQAAEDKGNRLRDAVAAKYGWRKFKFPGDERGAGLAEEGWIATAHPGAISSVRSPRDVPNLEPYAFVSNTGRIRINSGYRCVVEAASVRLPEGDQIARRMLTLSTAHRNAIHTLVDDRAVLEQLFATPDPRTVWDIREELVAKEREKEELQRQQIEMAERQKEEAARAARENNEAGDAVADLA